ncbi:prevent-host-death family protein [Desulfosporosinus orientis DSM 765]|uniref:Prevent-host-death family protein n=1 Tax=Desulfosporosinus orientis (strain ATCC 19365 / DSM 765 / NCIMB 8382 / VKM B-1628 / Singapore I) TaxID=768706 RepID=G7WBB7_DESOD|nr:type II toxin-antitoxin system Phd/YefM family antitoxin [Desulfosporosinus orientis]AET68246.1 prevent-host-death family protein [Desulfosporosinus orientis DSM 765]
MRVPSTEVQNNFGKYLKFVEVNEEIIVTKNGRDIARILSCDYPNKSLVTEGVAEYQTREGRVSYEEFLELVEASEQRFELIDGVIYNLASPSYEHQYAVNEIHGTFYNWFKNNNCIPLTAPFDITLFKAEDNICIVQPDIIVICDRDKMDKKGKYQGVPTLVVEVLSPSTRSKDTLKKLELYKQCGIKEYWMVDPKNNLVHIYILDKKEITDSFAFQKGAHEYVESAYFKGLKVALTDMFL